MNDEQNNQQPQEDTAEQVLWVAVVAVAVASVLPLVLAWKLAPSIATRPRIWAAGAGSLAAAVVVGGLSVGAFAVAVWSGWLTVWAPGWNTAAAVACWWLALLPWAYVLVRMRLPGIATDLDRGLIDPTRAEAVRRAATEGDRLRVRRVLRRALLDDGKDPKEPPMLGLLMDHDRRHWWVRLTDGHATRALKHARWVRIAADRIGRFVLPKVPPRVFVLGGSGAGKTTLLRVIVRAALFLGWRVVVIDAKGNEGDAAEMLRDAENIGASTVHYPSTPFDGWQGDADAVAQKALSLMPAGSPDFYVRQAQGALYAVASLAPWRDTAGMLARLDTPAPWCDAHDLRALTIKQQGVPVHQAVEATLRASTRGLDAFVQPWGWKWDDEQTDFVVCSVDLGASPAQRLAAGLMLTDLNAYRQARRGPNARPLLVIIDEAAALLDSESAPDLSATSEQVRSAGIGLVIAAQSVAGLGIQAARLLGAGSDLILGRMTDADAAATIAGTRKRQEVAHQGTAGGRVRSGETSAREQDTLRVDPNRLRDAQPGEFVVVESGQPVARWVYVVPPPEMPGGDQKPEAMQVDPVAALHPAAQKLSETQQRDDDGDRVPVEPPQWLDDWQAP